MSCEGWESLLSAYYDHELDGAVRGRLERHLGMCPRCRRRLDAFAELTAAVAPRVEPDPDFVVRFVAAKEREDFADSARAWQRLGMGLLPLAAGALLAVGLALWLSSREPSPPLTELEAVELGSPDVEQEGIPQDPVLRIAVGPFPEIEGQ